MYKEKITSLPYNSYVKPRINTIKMPKHSRKTALRCGTNIDFAINTGKCPIGTTWSLPIKNNRELQ